MYLGAPCVRVVFSLLPLARSFIFVKISTNCCLMYVAEFTLYIGFVFICHDAIA